MKAPRVKVNNPFLQQVFDKYSDYLDSLPKPKQVIAGEFIRKDETLDQIIIHGTPAGAGGGGGSVVSCECPFEVRFEQEEDSDPTTYKGTIEYGRVNNTLVDETEFATGIDTDEESSKFLVATISFSSVGGISNIAYEEETGIPDAHEPEEGLPTEAKVVMGVRTGINFKRIIGCGNLLVYPIPIQTLEENYYTYEVVCV